MSLEFNIIHNDAESMARSGVLTIGPVQVPTPAFMPVGTRGVVRNGFCSGSLGYRI